VIKKTALPEKATPCQIGYAVTVTIYILYSPTGLFPPYGL